MGHHGMMLYLMIVVNNRLNDLNDFAFVPPRLNVGILTTRTILAPNLPTGLSYPARFEWFRPLLRTVWRRLDPVCNLVSRDLVLLVADLVLQLHYMLRMRRHSVSSTVKYVFCSFLALSVLFPIYTGRRTMPPLATSSHAWG